MKTLLDVLVENHEMYCLSFRCVLVNKSFIFKLKALEQLCESRPLHILYWFCFSWVVSPLMGCCYLMTEPNFYHYYYFLLTGSVSLG